MTRHRLRRVEAGCGMYSLEVQRSLTSETSLELSRDFLEQGGPTKNPSIPLFRPDLAIQVGKRGEKLAKTENIGKA